MLRPLRWVRLVDSGNGHAVAAPSPTRGGKNVVQARTFSEMLEQALRRCRNRAIEAAKVIDELIQFAREMWEASQREESLGLTDDELAFYDALETNDSAWGRELAHDCARPRQDRTR